MGAASGGAAGGQRSTGAANRMDVRIRDGLSRNIRWAGWLRVCDGMFTLNTEFSGALVWTCRYKLGGVEDILAPQGYGHGGW